ncbi:beta strand repeat-containing protein [Actinokineospora inagensis]|uniref:beta strand repeat-containing protein n=1 Tax=Actinokineospora inagensis TaxID=103730 RepID=UPI0003FE4239|nr:hypothetical protein [Actinokineospora inagensis]
MQTWAKRGFQTALVTGGLLMLGTGIASADDNVNPDTPAPALDTKVVVDARVQNNAIGTVLGDKRLPDVNRTISTSPREVLKAVPGGTLVAPLADSASEKLLTGNNAPLRANKIVSGVTVPVDVSGNAIALGGDSSVTNNSTQTTNISRPVSTTGEDRAIAGNVVNLDYAAPVQVTGNAASILGDATTHNTADQTAHADGDITTTGADGTLSGNVVGAQGASPVQLNGNAVTVGGKADSDSTTSSDSLAGGVIKTDGEDSTLGGNGAVVPLTAPVRGTGTGLGVLGKATANSVNSTTAQSGAQSPDLGGNPVYVHTNGVDSTGGGNIVQPAITAPTTADCTSSVVVGQSHTTCASDLVSVAGGGNRSNGTDSVLGGAIGATSTAAPVSAIGNAAGVIGNATTDQNNVIDTGVGGTAITRGEQGVLSGTLVNNPISAPIDSCANGGVIGGNSTIACENITTTNAGGDAGTSGDDSVGGGNGGQIPVTVPTELISNGIGAGGNSDITATETKFSSAGGDANTADDNAVGAANLVNTPIAAPIQAFGNGVGAVANTTSDTALENQIIAGSDSKASATGGTASGNIVQSPAALPIQAFGIGGTVGGHGNAKGSNVSDIATGGIATTDGKDGSLAGNIATVPVAGALQPFGDSIAVAGKNIAGADNTVTTTAGDKATTSGQRGSISGNIVGAQAGPVVQAFGAAVSGVAGDNKANSTSSSTANSGGDLTTNGDYGFLSGTLADVPAGAFVQPHGDAVSAVGSHAFGISDNNTTGQVGGHSTTSGQGGSLNGIHLTAPTNANAPVYNVPVEVAANAVAAAKQVNTAHIGDTSVTDETPLRLPTVGGLEATELPFNGIFGGLPTQRSAMGSPLGGLSTGTLTHALPTSGTLPTSGLTGGLTGGGLPGASLVDGLPVAGLLGGGLPGGNVIGGLPTDGLTGGLPVHVTPPAAGRSNLPTDGLSGAFSGNLFQAPALPHLPVGGSSLPVNGLPVNALPVNGLPVNGLPVNGLPVNGLPVNGSALPVHTPALSGLDTHSALPAVSSLSDTQSQLRNLFH